eukprot:jgi/Picsp_1/1579/NSC_05057-R1_timing of cab expression 1
MIEKKRSRGRAAAASGAGAGSGSEGGRRMEVDHASTSHGRHASVRGKQKTDKAQDNGGSGAHEYVLMAGKPGSKSSPVKMEDDPMDVPNLHQLHVLVVDPDIESRGKTVSLLKECGYQVLSSKTGDEAFDVLKKEKENGVHVDVILKAHVPPKSVAIEFLEQLRKSEEYNDILVIVYSNSEDRDAVARCLSLGAVDHWIKPLRRNEVVNLWTKVWQQRHKSGADGLVEALPPLVANPPKRERKTKGSANGDATLTGETPRTSAGEGNDVAEVAEALTSLRSQKSSKPSSNERLQAKPCTSPRTEDPSGASGQFKYTPTQMVMPYVSPSSWPNPLSYGQYPIPWAMTPPPGDSQQEFGGKGRAGEEPRFKSLDAQQATWLRYQQQLHAMQMQTFAANALKSNTRAYPGQLAAGGWPMNVQYFSNWGPGVMAYKGTQTYNTPHGDGSNSQKYSVNSSTANSIRLNAVRKYKEKRRARKASSSTKIRYQSRKILADSRPRVRGQFVTGQLYDHPSKNFAQSFQQNEDAEGTKTGTGTLEPKSLHPDNKTALGTLNTSSLKTSKCRDLVSGLDDTDGNMQGRYVDKHVSNPSSKPETSRGRSDSGSNTPNYGGS